MALPPDKNESGKNYPEGEPKEERLRYYEVVCPKCHANIGYPCFNKRGQAEYFWIHVARLLVCDTLTRVEKMRNN